MVWSLLDLCRHFPLAYVSLQTGHMVSIDAEALACFETLKLPKCQIKSHPLLTKPAPVPYERKQRNMPRHNRETKRETHKYVCMPKYVYIYIHKSYIYIHMYTYLPTYLPPCLPRCIATYVHTQIITCGIYMQRYAYKYA